MKHTKSIFAAAVALLILCSPCIAEAATENPVKSIESAKCEQPTTPPKRYTATLFIPGKNDLIHVPQPLIGDQYLSPYSGSSFNTVLLTDYKQLDDEFLYDSHGKINFLWGMGRLGKIIVEDSLFKYLMVLQHEYFGHGYRGREFHFSYLGYKIGCGHGWTSFLKSEYAALTYPQRTALLAAGMEADTIMSQQIRNNWFLSNQIDRRDALLYTLSALDQPRYIYNTYASGNQTTSVGNDVLGYISNINSWYGSNVMSLGKLRGMAWWSYLDPNLYYSIYSVGSYIINSSAYTDMLMFNVKGYKYLPTPGLLLTPYGPEWQLQNNIVTPKQQLLQVNLRYGKTSFIKSYGVDVLMSPITDYKGFKFGNKLYLWHQPLFLKQNTAVGVPSSFGIADYISVQRHLYKQCDIYGEFGYKTAGYIQGNPLGNSWVWRVGLVMKW